MKKLWKVEINGQERIIALVSKFGYLSLPVGTVMYSLNGEKFIVGEDEPDQNYHLEGYIPYGILEEEV